MTPPISPASAPVPPDGYLLLNLCPRLLLHDDIGSGPSFEPRVEVTVEGPPDALVLSPATRMRRPFQDDRFYSPAQPDGRLGIFLAIPENESEAVFEIQWKVFSGDHVIQTATHAMALTFAHGPAIPVFHQDRDRPSGSAIYSTGDAGFLRQDRSTSMLVPTTVLRRGDLSWRDDSIVLESEGAIVLHDTILLKPVDVRDFMTWTNPEIAPQPHEQEEAHPLQDPKQAAQHYANAVVVARPDEWRVLTTAVDMARSFLERGAPEATEDTICPAIPHLCDWWNSRRPPGFTEAAGVSVWVRLDDEGGYWDARHEMPNLDIDVSAYRSSIAVFGDSVLLFFHQSREECIRKTPEGTVGIIYRLSDGTPFTVVDSSADDFHPDRDAVVALAGLPDMLQNLYYKMAIE